MCFSRLSNRFGMKLVYTTDPKQPRETRLPEFSWIPNRLRPVLISIVGEFVGTYMFLFVAFAATQVATTPLRESDSPLDTSTVLNISLAFGFSMALNVGIFFQISDGLFNPAVGPTLLF